MIWNESIECMDRESLRKIQSIRLKKIVEHVYHNTPFYRKKMQELGITPDDINSIDDIVKLPFTTKYDLRDNYPFGLCAVPMSQIVRIHASFRNDRKADGSGIYPQRPFFVGRMYIACFYCLWSRTLRYISGFLWLRTFYGWPGSTRRS